MATETVKFDLAPLDLTYPTLQVCAICEAKAKFATIAKQLRTNSYGQSSLWWDISDYVCGQEECYNLWILQQ